MFFICYKASIRPILNFSPRVPSRLSDRDLRVLLQANYVNSEGLMYGALLTNDSFNGWVWRECKGVMRSLAREDDEVAALERRDGQSTREWNGGQEDVI